MEGWEYTEMQDLTKLKIVKEILDGLFCYEDPNYTRIESAKANINLCIKNINERVAVEEEKGEGDV